MKRTIKKLHTSIACLAIIGWLIGGANAEDLVTWSIVDTNTATDFSQL